MTYIPPSKGTRENGSVIYVNPKQMWFPWFVVVACVTGAVFVSNQIGAFRTNLNRRLESIEVILKENREAVERADVDRFRRKEFEEWHKDLQEKLSLYADRYDLPDFELPDIPNF